MAILWIVSALVIAFALVARGAKRTRRLLPDLELPPGETLPATPLQRLAGRSLLAVAALATISAGLVIVAGPPRFLATAAAWMVGLTETFHSAGAVPAVYLYLMFWSLLLVSQIAWLGSVVLTYRRS